jgi:hypothetical protein
VNTRDGTAWRLLSPDLIDQLLDGDYLICLGKQDGEQHFDFLRTNCRAMLPLAHPERPKYLIFHDSLLTLGEIIA